ncbi:aminotransferase class V-fold PLP-dependent enzyme [Ningiella sp. W23]|uniref:aminotransferase class V-fold PLP-dependent enzyme n=1 Tax=Ningiella sp. W23 TaxID=3023715 RepID=UPI003757A32B
MNGHKKSASINERDDAFIKPDGVYLLNHSAGPLTHASVQANNKYLQLWQEKGGDAWPHWLDELNTFSVNLAQLLHCDPATVCPQPSVSMGFTQWLTALCTLRDSQGSSYRHRKHIIMHRSAFPSLGFVVEGLAKRHGLELVLLQGPVNDLDAWREAMENPSALCCLFTHVHSNTGEVSDIASLSELCKAHKVYCAVDIAQSVGIMPINLAKWQADAIFGSCIKWLSGGPGAGFLINNLPISRNFMPDHLGWFSHQNPFEFDIEHFVEAKNASVFLGGTPSVQPFMVASASIKVISEMGVENRLAWTKQLQKMLMSQLDAKFQQNLEQIGGTLCIDLPQANLNGIQYALSEADIKCDFRASVVRLSFNSLNTEEDIALVANCLQSR